MTQGFLSGEVAWKDGYHNKASIKFDDFKKIREQDFYYIDKTGLIKELMNNWGEVNLFTRPRRFGKSINMSMLKAFFEYGCETSLLRVEIAGEKELWEIYGGSFRLFCHFRRVSGNNIQDALGMMRSIIGNGATLRFQFIGQWCVDWNGQKNSIRDW